MKQTVRTFVAVEINDTNRACAEELIAKLQGAAADVKWVEAGNLHLTLKFLGDVPAREIARVCEVVQRGAGKVEAFELHLRGAGAFPNDRRPRTLWLGSGDGALSLPRGAAIDQRDRLYVVDAAGQDVKVYDVSGPEPDFLYVFGDLGMGDGQFNYPNDIALDATGRLYVVDRENDRVQVWSH